MVPYTPLAQHRHLELAKQIVAEILRCSGGRVDSKGRLFKVFYYAHLFYAKNNPDYLSDWPIVRMPHGPGIGDAPDLFSSMAQDGTLEIRNTNVGPYPATEFRSKSGDMPALPLAAIDAIREAVAFTKHKTASELSELTHQYSNAWKSGQDGDRLNVCDDLLTEEEFLKLRDRVKQGLADLKAIAG
jgi:hypothetical protein